MVLTLTLLKTRVLLVDDIQLPLPSHDLTIGAALFNGCTYFHDELFVFYWYHGIRQGSFHDNNYLYLNIILPLDRS